MRKSTSGTSGLFPSALWSLETVAQAFKSRGRYREGIAAHLDLLTDLGMLSRVEPPRPPLAPAPGHGRLAGA